jgi:hypothetical protein
MLRRRARARAADSRRRPRAAPQEGQKVLDLQTALGLWRLLLDGKFRLPPPLRTNRTRRVLHPVLIGHDTGARGGGG